MAAAAKKIKVTPDTELASLLEQAATAPVLLDKDGELYRIDRVEADEDIWADYDPDLVRQAIEKTTGTWAGVEANKLIADIYRRREEGSRPASRP